MPATDDRLTTQEVAEFVANGFLRFDAIVPDHVNQAVLAELPLIERAKLTAFGLGERDDSAALVATLPDTLDSLSTCYLDHPGLGSYIRLPAIQGIIHSLVGDDPIFDHDFVHHLRGGHSNRQHLHPDAITDTSTPDFDIQLFYFPHAVEPGGGGTRFVPGSHLRRVPSSSTARYQQLVGEQFYSGPAGTVLVFHHGLWHAGQDNPSDRDRWMHKIRLGPAGAQQRLWNLDDFESMQNDASDHVFAKSRVDSVASVLRQTPPWMGVDEARCELTERARLWRYLSGDDNFDVDYYLRRTERRSRES